jgi:hypothetical protein
MTGAGTQMPATTPLTTPTAVVAPTLQAAGGTATAVEARVSLPSNFVSSGSSVIPSIQIAGITTYSNGVTAYPSVLIEPSVGYITFGIKEI